MLNATWLEGVSLILGTKDPNPRSTLGLHPCTGVDVLVMS